MMARVLTLKEISIEKDRLGFRENNFDPGTPNPSQPSICAVLRHSLGSNSLRPNVLQPTRLLCPWGFSRKEHWSVLPWPPPWDLPSPGIELRSPALQVDSLTN